MNRAGLGKEGIGGERGGRERGGEIGERVILLLLVGAASVSCILKRYDFLYGTIGCALGWRRQGRGMKVGVGSWQDEDGGGGARARWGGSIFLL